MNLKLALGGAAVAALVGGLFWWRASGSERARPETAAGSGQAPIAVRSAGAEPVADVPMFEADAWYDDDPAGRERLEGQVVDDEELPVAGATVVIDSNPRREVVTEEDGSFAFDKLVPRAYRIEARSGDGLAGPVRMRLTTTSEPIVLRLHRASTIEITVTDAATGGPVAGALVEVRGLGAVSSITGADGVANIRGIGAGTPWIKVSAPGYASVFKLITSEGTGGVTVKRTVALEPGVSVEGTVADMAGQPVEGARVLVDEMGGRGRFDARLDATVTDAKGRWRITGVPRATVQFRASHPRFAPGSSPPVSLADGQDRTGIAIALDAGARVAGRVVSAEGAPVPASEVYVGEAYARSELVRRAHCDDRGRFELVGLPRTQLHLVAQTEEASSALVPLDTRQKRDLSSLEIVLDGTDRITGTVVTTSGELVPEARVVAAPDIETEITAKSVERLRGNASTVADGGGHFEISGLQPGSYRLRAIRPGTPSDVLGMRLGAAIDSNARDVEVVVADLTAVVGVVAFEDGSHPRSFAIAIGTSAPKTFAGTDGGFRIDDVPTGERLLYVNGADLVGKLIEHVQIEPGDEHDLGTITVKKGRAVYGRVLEADGQPVEGALVFVGAEVSAGGREVAPFWEESDGVKRTTTAADGGYRVSGIGSGPAVVLADHGALGRSPAVSIPAGRDDVNLDVSLQTPGALQGRITVNGRPTQGGVGMRQKGGADANFFVAAGPDGFYRYDKLAPGDYVAFAWFERGSKTSGGEGQSRPVRISSGKTAELDIDFAVGDIDVALQISSQGDVVQYGYGVIVSFAAIEEPTVLTISEARAIMAESANSGSIKEGLIVEDRKILFTGVVPGQYAACASPMMYDPRDPAAAREFERKGLETKVYCAPAVVTESPKQQTIVVPVQPVD